VVVSDTLCDIHSCGKRCYVVVVVMFFGYRTSESLSKIFSRASLLFVSDHEMKNIIRAVF
jgi:hypothetical protein